MKRKSLTLAFVSVLALACGAAFAGYPVTSYLPPDVLAGLAGLAAVGALPTAAMSGELDVKGITEALTKQGTAWEEFKKTNDERIAKLAKGEAVEDLESKLAKMNLDLSEAGAAIKEIALKAGRPQLSGDTQERNEKELKSFNAVARAAAIEAGKSFAPLSAEGYAQYKAAVGSFIRVGDRNMSADEVKAINVGTATQGGFLVGFEMEAGIERVVHRYSAMRQLARVIPIGSASYKKLVKTSGTSGGTRGGETATPAAGNSPGWSEIEFKPGTYLSDQRITMESLEDSVQDVEGDLMEEIGIEFAEMEGADFIAGDGVNGPRGFQSYTMIANANYAWGKVGFTVSGAAADFATTNPSDKLIDLQHSLKRQYRGNAAWAMNDATLAAIRKFKDGQGNYLWGMTAPSNLMSGAVGTLLGHPVVTDDFMPDLGANTFPVAFGDFKRAYYVIDRKGMSILRDPFTAVPYVKFVARRRVGGGIANFEALKVLKCST
ncbi:MAG: phage major capsid protein [Rhodoferax sp.]|nr:phage major capsid protein [Rhodoferax sp.]